MSITVKKSHLENTVDVVITTKVSISLGKTNKDGGNISSTDTLATQHAKRMRIWISFKSGKIHCPSCGEVPIDEDQSNAVWNLTGDKKKHTIIAMHRSTPQHISKRSPMGPKKTEGM